ncbi:hypothetical protein [Endozoicomonas elysicola]|uniref:Uncharacterized protein n=1 Tax=Endozoicomonas elysicola TaxID=305900 RepID=A0A081KH24_9GAMM|nr:hypothetical protein [Endozoicomonas elysicola]KEI73450.1 hypothetical protein GV64_24425 [Endozoicomonas elysicola]
MAKQPESNPWPGFVDALSTTLLVFVFLVVVLILVVTALSVQVGFDIAKSAIETDKKSAGTRDALDIGQQASVEADFDKEIISEALEVQLESQASVDVKDKLIRIKYQDFNSRLAETARAELDKWLKENLDSIQDKTIYIISLLNDPGIAKTVTYEVSFSRITLVRAIMTKLGIPSENIKIRLDDSGTDQRNEVIIKVVEKES